jgi:Tol biopolymer transport system component
MNCQRMCVCHVLPLALGLLIMFPLYHQDGAASPRYGAWSPAANLGSIVNTEFAEFAPHTSKDGLTLYFSSTRPESYGSFGGEDLWVSQRAGADAPWGPATNLGGALNTGANERSPALSRDGHYLFFASDRPGGLGGFDIWVSWRTHTHDVFGWEPPVNLGSGVNSQATDAGPAFFENDDAGLPQLYIASSRSGGSGGLDIYVSALVRGLFQPPALLAELNTAQNDLTPGIRHDGLEIVIASSRPGGNGGQDLWSSTRSTVNGTWSTPVNLGVAVNSGSIENFPSISADNTSLFFNSDRPGGVGASDLYVSTRQK